MGLFRSVYLFILAALSVFASTSAAAESGLKVVVTVAPLRGIVEPLLPADSTLTVLMQPGRSEHGYEFSPRELAQLAEADIVVYVGLNLEPRVAEVLAAKPSPSRAVVCFGEVVELQKPGEPVPNTDHQHDHEHGEECAHGPIDQHLWLDPVLVNRLIPAVGEVVRRTVVARGGSQEVADQLHEAEAKHMEAVSAVDREWREGIANLGEVAIITHHNAFGRLAERYGFSVAAAIRAFEGREPTPADIAAVVSEIKSRKVRAIFVEPQFSAKTAERIAKSANVKLGVLDPLGTGDWFALMRSNLESITAAHSQDESK